MSRSGWRDDPPVVYGLVIAAALLAIVTLLDGLTQPNHHLTTDQQKHYADQAQSKRPVASAPPVQKFEGEEEKWPCYSGEENRNSDLCAQWKAADAASDAAWWAMVSTVLAVVGTGFLLYNLKLTRDAVRLAVDAARDQDRHFAIAERNAASFERSAAAAAQSAMSSIEIGRSQVKAFLAVSQCEAIIQDDGTIGVKYTASNSGNSPAQNVRIDIEIGFIVGEVRTNTSIDIKIISSFPANRSRQFNIVRKCLLQNDQFAHLTKVLYSIQVEFAVMYTDIFGTKTREETGYLIWNLDGKQNNVWHDLQALRIPYKDTD